MGDSHSEAFLPNGSNLGSDSGSRVAPPSYADAEASANRYRDTDADFRSYIVVMNEKSGSSNVPRLQTFMETRAAELGKEIKVIKLNRDMDLARELRQHDAEVYVAAGGDGTLAAVADCALRDRKVFAAVPCGTANVFAKEHFIPADSMEAAELALTSRHVEALDVLSSQGATYLCHISIGTYSWITTHTNPEHKRRFGRIAYIANAIKLTFRERIWTFQLTVDGQRIVRRASTIMVTNAGSMGATGMRWGENIVTSDGIAEICVIKARSFKHYLSLFFAFLLRKPHKHLKEYFQVHSEATIEGPAQLPVRADGEEIAHGGFHFKILPQALRVVLPEPAPIKH